MIATTTSDTYTHVAWVDHGPHVPGTTGQMISLLDGGKDMWPLYDPDAERNRRVECDKPRPWHKMNRHEKRAAKTKERLRK